MVYFFFEHYTIGQKQIVRRRKRPQFFKEMDKMNLGTRNRHIRQLVKMVDANYEKLIQAISIRKKKYKKYVMKIVIFFSICINEIFNPALVNLGTNGTHP